jgi:phage terminase Nu1 subunit (DNA packaging protein)
MSSQIPWLELGLDPPADEAPARPETPAASTQKRPGHRRTTPETERASTGKPEGDTVGPDALAEWLGVSRATVLELARREVLKPEGRGRYPLRESIKAYCADLREKAAGRAGALANPSLTAERVRVTRAQAEALEFKNAAARGELLPAADVESAWAAILRDVRAGMLAVPSRVSQRLGHLTPADLDTIDREIRDTLAEVSDAS